MFRPNSPHTVGRGGTRGSARSGTGSKDPGIARRSPSSLPSSFKVAHLGSDRRDDQTQDRWGASSPRLWRKKKGKFRPIHGIQDPGRRLAWESGEACRVCTFERWEVETCGQTRKGAMSPRRKRRSSAPLPNHRRAEEGMPCRGTRWVCPQPLPRSGLPRPRFSLLT